VKSTRAPEPDVPIVADWRALLDYMRADEIIELTMLARRLNRSPGVVLAMLVEAGAAGEARIYATKVAAR
jgi:hypothetical protein